jgi:hypothetical protein
LWHRSSSGVNIGLETCLVFLFSMTLRPVGFFCPSAGDDDEDLQALENGTNSAKKSRRKSKTPAKTRKIAPSKYGCL